MKGIVKLSIVLSGATVTAATGVLAVKKTKTGRKAWDATKKASRKRWQDAKDFVETTKADLNEDRAYSYQRIGELREEGKSSWEAYQIVTKECAERRAKRAKARKPAVKQTTSTDTEGAEANNAKQAETSTDTDNTEAKAEVVVPAEVEIIPATPAAE